MEPINNSKIKEEIRIKNLTEANVKRYEIETRVNEDVKKVVDKKPYPDGPKLFLMLAMAIMVSIKGGFGGFIIGGILGFGVGYLSDLNVQNYNKRLEPKRQSIRDAGDREIQAVYAEADAKTRREIKEYDAAVQASYERIMKNPSVVKRMVEQNVKMFQRMVSHASAESYVRFIEALFTFEVRTTGIYYYYQSQYTNQQDDFDFHKERFRPLQKDSECEGVAKALAKLTIMEMRKLYPPNSLNITVTHNDAKVTLHFKAANKNFKAAKNIL